MSFIENFIVSKMEPLLFDYAREANAKFDKYCEENQIDKDIVGNKRNAFEHTYVSAKIAYEDGYLFSELLG